MQCFDEKLGTIEELLNTVTTPNVNPFRHSAHLQVHRAVLIPTELTNLPKKGH